MRKKPKSLAFLLALGLVLAACGDGDGGADTTTTGDIATDVGVDLDAGTITVGLLSDLSDRFSPLVQVIVTGQEAYWASVNADGGINGMTVNLETRDTAYDVEIHAQLYEELKTQVVAFGHSTGSPHTVGINPQLQADGILAIPLTWYSGWSDPAINSNLVPHGAPYCLESMNVLEYLTQQVPDAATLAIASAPGDYGEDSAAGAQIAAEQLDLEVVYDGTGLINAADPATLAEVAAGIAGSDADLVYVTTDPTSFGSIYGQAIGTGFEATWSGAGPSWNPALVGPESPIRDNLAAQFYVSGYYAPWGHESEGNAFVRDLIGEYAPDAPALDYYAEGVIEAKIMHQALLRAYENGDMTQAGVLAAAKSLESVTFDGLAPDEAYVGEANERLQRATYISRPDPEGLAGGTSTGVILQEAEYISETAAAFEFTEACYSLS